MPCAKSGVCKNYAFGFLTHNSNRACNIASPSNGMHHAEQAPIRGFWHGHQESPSFLPTEHSMKTYIRSNEKGFTLAELMITVGVISVVMVGATAIMPGMLSGSRADGASSLLINTLRLARDRAISERRNMELVFTAPDHIQVVRQEIGGLATNPVIMDVYLENQQKFLRFTALSDTPDRFGLTNAPVAFGPTPGSPATIMFTSEGTLVDPSGDTINGTIFIGTTATLSSARAITVFGPTALIRAWRWDGVKWSE